MGTNKVYHIKREIASAAAEFAGIAALSAEVFLFWTVAAAIANGTPIPAWCGVSACALVCALILCAARAVIIRMPVRRARRVRCGVIDADTICRVMGGKR